MWVFHKRIATNGTIGLFLHLLDANPLQPCNVLFIYALYLSRWSFCIMHECIDHGIQKSSFFSLVVSTHYAEGFCEGTEDGGDVAWNGYCMLACSVRGRFGCDFSESREECGKVWTSGARIRRR